MSAAEEAQWARTLHASKRAALPTATLPLRFEKKHLREELVYCKTKLRASIKDKTQTNIQSLVDRLITLRAKLVSLRLREKKQGGKILDPATIEREFLAYYKDCYRLVYSVKKLNK